MNKIHPGNCFDLFDKLEDKSIDLIFSDVPYITALRDLNNWNDGLDFKKLAIEFNRLLKDTGQVALFCDFPTSIEIWNSFSEYFRFRFLFIWKKGLPTFISKYQPRSECEFIIVFCKLKARRQEMTFNASAISRPGKPYQRKSLNQSRTRKSHRPYITINESGERWPGQILEHPTKCQMKASERTKHPTQKPLSLCSDVIKTLSNPGDIILDPFAGSGTIPVACIRLKRSWIAFERDPEYFAEAERRIFQEQAQMVLF